MPTLFGAVPEVAKWSGGVRLLGQDYRSQNLFWTRKEAMRAVAKLAFVWIKHQSSFEVAFKKKKAAVTSGEFTFTMNSKVNDTAVPVRMLLET